MTLSTQAAALAVLLGGILIAQPTSFRYFYDDAGELFRVLDSTNTLLEYDYDLTGNIIQIQRSTISPTSLTIFNIAPLSGPVGQTVTIYGQNFSPIVVGNTVQFGGVTATVVSASSTVLVVQIPPGFTSGTVTLTVNGVTINGGPLTFIPPPAITSIAPNTGDSGQPETVVIQGLNLTGATFSIGSGGYVLPVSTSATQATVTITPGAKLGPYTMVATAPSGAASSTIASDANMFLVFYSAGNNSTNSSFTVFNSAGPTTFPTGSNEANQSFTVYNSQVNPGNILSLPAGSNESDQSFTVFNLSTAPDTFALPAGSNETSQAFTVFNSPVSSGSILSIPAGSSEASQAFTVFNVFTGSNSPSLIPAGFNEAWQLFTTQNGPSGSAPMSLEIPAPAGVRRTGAAAAPGETGDRTGEPLNLLAGQTVQITLRPPQFLPYLELDAEGQSLVSTTTGSLSVPFTAPFGVPFLQLKGFGQSSSGTSTDAIVQPVRVETAPDRTISGRVLDTNGVPVAGAAVTWQANGLAAEYYRLSAEASAIPEIRGAPERRSFVSALNYPNPRQVFGMDPMGVSLGGSYALRLSGRIRIDAPGTYSFELVAHRGARLAIDGRLVVEGMSPGADSVTLEGNAELTAGTHEIQVVGFESGGAAALQLLWTPPGGSRSVVPPSVITAEAPPSSRAVTDSAGRFTMQAPAALDGVIVKLLVGVGSVQVEQ